MPTFADFFQHLLVWHERSTGAKRMDYVLLSGYTFCYLAWRRVHGQKLTRAETIVARELADTRWGYDVFVSPTLWTVASQTLRAEEIGQQHWFALRAAPTVPASSTPQTLALNDFFWEMQNRYGAIREIAARQRWGLLKTAVRRKITTDPISG